MSSLFDLIAVAASCIAALIWLGVATHGVYLVPQRFRAAFASMFDRTAEVRPSLVDGGSQ